MKTTGNVMARAVVAKESRRPHSKPRSCASKSFTLLSLAALDCTGVDDLERNAAGLSAEVRVIDVTHRSRRYAVLVALSTCIFGCDPGGTSGRTSPGNPPALATISGSEMQSGFASGPLRHPRTLSSYKITKYPITWAEYDACVRAGGCKSADASACSDEARAPYAGYTLPDYEHKADESPAVCVGERNAETYCKWIGGSLPTLDEWLLAARGTQPRRFSWGDAPSACDQHVMVPQLLQRATIHGGTASAEGEALPRLPPTVAMLRNCTPATTRAASTSEG